MPIYMARAGKEGMVKIGLAASVNSRVKDLQIGSSEKLEVIRVVDGNHQMERWFHYRFSNLRKHGEWFVFTPEMLTVLPPTLVELTSQELALQPIKKKPRKLSHEKFLKVLSCALHEQLPPWANKKKWLAIHAKTLNISSDALNNYMLGENMCPGHVLMNLFECFSRKFERRVRGTQATELDIAAEALQEIAERILGTPMQPVRKDTGS